MTCAGGTGVCPRRMPDAYNSNYLGSEGGHHTGIVADSSQGGRMTCAGGTGVCPRRMPDAYNSNYFHLSRTLKERSGPSPDALVGMPLWGKRG